MSDSSNGAPRAGAFQSARLWFVLIGIVAGCMFYAVGAVPYEVAKRFDKEPPRFARVIYNWPNLLSLIAFGVAVGLLTARLTSLARQRRAFSIGLLGDDPDTLILPKDALDIRKRQRQLSDGQRQLVLMRMLDAGLQRARANWSAEDVGTAVKTEAELVAGGTEADYSTIRYLAWAIPSIGFVGTVMGIGKAMGYFGKEGDEDFVSKAAEALGFAFDTTFVALVLSLILMYMVYRVQARDDAFLVDATRWCMRRFVYRMHIPTEQSL